MKKVRFICNSCLRHGILSSLEEEIICAWYSCPWCKYKLTKESIYNMIYE